MPLPLARVVLPLLAIFWLLVALAAFSGLAGG
jgi:hypothetical protein